MQNFNNCGQSTNMDCGQNVENNGGQNVETSSHISPLTSHSSGITLIALIITIVIMLILAGITINLTLGENGIFLKAKDAKQQYEEGSMKEKVALELANLEIEELSNGGTLDIGKKGDALEKVTRGTVVYNADLTKILGVETSEGIVLVDAENESELQIGIKVGDTVNYIPDINNIGVDPDYGQTNGAYTGVDDTCATNTGLQTSEQLITQENLTWKILDIEDGKVKLTSSYPMSQTLNLAGWSGVCNGVYILHDVCEQLYSKTDYGQARSITYEDLLKLSILENGGITETVDDPNGGNYPTIFGIQNDFAVNNVYGTEIGKSEQTELIEHSNAMSYNPNGFRYNNYSEIQFHVFSLHIIRDASNANLKDIITKDSINNEYWIATRNKTGDYFSIMAIRYWGGIFTGTNMTMHRGYGKDSYGYGGIAARFKIKPIVELDNDVIFTYDNENSRWNLSKEL